MLTGDEVRTARARARMTQEQAAQQAGVSLRTWGNWERSDSLTSALEARVREVIGQYLTDHRAPVSSALSSVSDAQLLAEIAARFERGRRHGTATTEARATPAPNPHHPTADDPTVALDLAARTTPGLRLAKDERDRQDRDAEGPQSP